jgi:hypothetical protein
MQKFVNFVRVWSCENSATEMYVKVGRGGKYSDRKQENEAVKRGV